MGRLLALLAGFAPRVALLLIWIFTNLVDRAFTGFLIPLLGLLIFPYATLFYVLAFNPVTEVSGWGWAFVVLGFSSTSGTGPVEARPVDSDTPPPSDASHRRAVRLAPVRPPRFSLPGIRVPDRGPLGVHGATVLVWLPVISQTPTCSVRWPVGTRAPSGSSTNATRLWISARLARRCADADAVCRRPPGHVRRRLGRRSRSVGRARCRRGCGASRSAG